MKEFCENIDAEENSFILQIVTLVKKSGRVKIEDKK